jgi:hypothetical protein
MKHKLKYLLLFILLTTKFYCQPDCVVRFKYIGTILTGDSVLVEKIGLPGTPFLCGYEKKNAENAFTVSNVIDGRIEENMVSHMSSEFCREAKDIFKYVFIGKRNEFPLFVYVKGAKKKIWISVPVKQISFSYDKIKRMLIIDLGKINT